VHGTPDMLILKTLAFQCMHGYGIAVRLEQTSGEQRCYREQPAGYMYRLAAPLSSTRRRLSAASESRSVNHA